MQIIINIMFVIMIAVAIFYWVKYEKECEHSYEVEDKLCELNCKSLKTRTQMMMIYDLVQDYRKGENIHTVMRDISNIVLSNKKDISTDQSD